MDKGKMLKLNSYHVFFLVQNSMIGVNLLSLPHTLAPAGYEQWTIPIFMGLIANLTIIPMIYLNKKYPQDSFFVINKKVLGKYIGLLLNLAIMGYIAVLITSVLEKYIEVIQAISLPDMNKIYIYLFIILVVIYAVSGGIKSVARLCILAFFLTAWMVYFLQWSFRPQNFSHFFPLFEMGIPNYLTAIRDGYPSMFGYELILFYFPYIIKKDKAIKHVSLGIWTTVLFYLAITVTCILYFSLWEIDNVKYPILSIFQAVELSFLERIENFGITLWVSLVLSTVALYLWALKKGMHELLSKNHVWHLYACVGVITCFIFLPISEVTRESIYNWGNYLGYSIIASPLLLLLINWMKGGTAGK